MTITELKWKTMTRAVNEIKSPNQFLKKLLWRNHVTLPTEDIEVSVINKGREVAPFVRKNGEAVMVGGYTSTNQTVQAPNIRIKRPLTPSELLFGRQPGTVIFITPQDQNRAIRQHISRDLQVLSDLTTNAEEWLCALALQGTITYSVADQEVFQITYPKPSAHNITLSTYWNDGTLSNVKFHDNIHTVKRLLSDEVGLAPTDCILGTEASDALRALVVGGHVVLDNRNINTGQATLVEQFSDDGVIYLGRLDGIDFWEYGRTADVNGVATPMVRAKYAEFVSRSAASERVLYYGAIPDMDALEGRLLQAERFSKSWKTPDPSQQWSLLHSRPLPVPRRPGATVSMKVVSG